MNDRHVYYEFRMQNGYLGWGFSAWIQYFGFFLKGPSHRTPILSVTDNTSPWVSFFYSAQPVSTMDSSWYFLTNDSISTIDRGTATCIVRLRFFRNEDITPPLLQSTFGIHGAMSSCGMNIQMPSYQFQIIPACFNPTTEARNMDAVFLSIVVCILLYTSLKEPIRSLSKFQSVFFLFLGKFEHSDNLGLPSCRYATTVYTG